MAEYKLSYTASEINRKLGDIDNLLEKVNSSVMPDVSVNDNGAFLRVVNGAWSVSPLTNAEEVAF